MADVARLKPNFSGFGELKGLKNAPEVSYGIFGRKSFTEIVK